MGARETTITFSILLLALAMFFVSPVTQLADSRYALLITERLLTHGTLTLDAYAPPRPGPPDDRPVTPKLPYPFWTDGDHVYHYAPIGTSVLSLPFVGVAKLAGISVVGANGEYQEKVERTLQHSLASLLMAALAALFYLTARLALPRAHAVWVAVGGALGTQVLSTASRALWSHTFQLLLLGLALWLVLRGEIEKRSPRPVLLATILSWAYVVRPTSLVSILVISGYVALRQPRRLPIFGASGCFWLALFVAHAWLAYGAALPPYYRASRLSFRDLWSALAGHLVSPARGLLVYVPLAGFVAFLVVRYRTLLRPRSLAIGGCAAVVGHIFVASAFPHWWGGRCYGPRLLTDLVPWLVLLGTLGLDAHVRARVASPSAPLPSRAVARPLAVAGVVLLAASVYMNGAGAVSKHGMDWNVRPVSVREAPERLWDWRDPPFLRWLAPERGVR